MRTVFGLICLVFLLVVIARQSGVPIEHASTGSVARATPRRYMQPAPARIVAARFEANEVAAERDYKGKVGAVLGVVTDIGVDIMGEPFLILDGDQSPYGVQCGFGRENREAIAALHKGETVSVQGAFGGKIMHVQMTDCAIQH